MELLCTPVNEGNCGRPHVIYSKENGNYVLWVNAGSPGYVVFISENHTRYVRTKLITFSISLFISMIMIFIIYEGKGTDIFFFT